MNSAPGPGQVIVTPSPIDQSISAKAAVAVTVIEPALAVRVTGPTVASRRAVHIQTGKPMVAPCGESAGGASRMSGADSPISEMACSASSAGDTCGTTTGWPFGANTTRGHPCRAPPPWQIRSFREPSDGECPPHRGSPAGGGVHGWSTQDGRGPPDAPAW
jgi:hypothetical protein